MKKEDFFEVLGELDDDIVKSAKTTMQKKMNRKIWSTIAACLCLILIGAFAAPKLFGKTPETTQPTKINLLVVNEVKNVTNKDMDVQLTFFNKLPYDMWMAVLDDFHKLVGITYEEFTGKISDSFECYNFYSLSIPGYKDANLNDEYRLHDYVFEYKSESGGEIIIAICSSEKPLRDCFIMCDNPKQSEINGVSVMVYGYQGTFMVEFSCENINYDIETSNITLEELKNLLTGIIE